MGCGSLVHLSLMCCRTMMCLGFGNMMKLLVSAARCCLMRTTLMAWISYMRHLCMGRGPVMCSMHCFDVVTMRLWYFVRVSNRFRCWFVMLDDSRMNRGLRMNLNRMALGKDNWDLVFFLLNSFVMIWYWNMMLRCFMMHGYFLLNYFLMSYSGLYRKRLLVDNRLWSMIDSHRCVMMWLFYFMGHSLMLSGRMDRKIVVYRSFVVYRNLMVNKNILMNRNNFMLLNYWMLNWCLLWGHLMLDSLFVLRDIVILWWNVMVNNCWCFRMRGRGTTCNFLMIGCFFFLCLRKELIIERFRHFDILEIVIQVLLFFHRLSLSLDRLGHLDISNFSLLKESIIR